MLSLISLGKIYQGSRSPAVNNLTLDLKGGEILGLVGLNGAGKSTTIRMAAGVIRPSSGHISVNGIDVVTDKAEASRHIGWLPEFPNFEPGERVLSQLRYFAGFHGLTGASAEKQCKDLLDEVGLHGLERSKFRTFSQGMKKRLALAVSLLGDPDFLLFDEILNGLDPEGVNMVRNLLIGLRESGKGVLLSSHILKEVQQVADRVAIVHEGRLLRVLTREEVNGGAGVRLRITITNVDDAALQFLRTLGEVSSEGATVLLSSLRVDSEEVNSALINRNYKVKSLMIEEGNLEDIFFKIVEQNGEVRDSAQTKDEQNPIVDTGSPP